MTEKKKEQIEGDFKINDDSVPFSGKGFDVIINAVSMNGGDDIELKGDLDDERDVSELFRNNDGYCLICELRCRKTNCTKCEVPKFSEKITTEVLRSITSHKGAETNIPVKGCFRKTMVIRKGDGKDE